jgi:hypothetical protein
LIFRVFPIRGSTACYHLLFTPACGGYADCSKTSFERQQRANPLAVAGWSMMGMVHHRNRDGGEQTANVFVAALAGLAQAFLAATRILPLRHPQPRGKLSTRSEQGGIGNRARP